MVIRLEPDIPFEELKEFIRDKFMSSAEFFKDAKVKLAFTGRQLTEEEEKEILDIIDVVTTLKVVCILDKESFDKQMEEEQIQKEEQCVSDVLFFRGDLYSGQTLESESSIIIAGDVHQGAKVISKGNVIVIGSLKGMIHAGAGFKQNAFAAALSMEPAKIKIGTYNRKGRISKRGSVFYPRIAYIEGGMICFDLIS